LGQRFCARALHTEFDARGAPLQQPPNGYDQPRHITIELRRFFNLPVTARNPKHKDARANQRQTRESFISSRDSKSRLFEIDLARRRRLQTQ
jgi:hypothetical protein